MMKCSWNNLLNWCFCAAYWDSCDMLHDNLCIEKLWSGSKIINVNL